MKSTLYACAVAAFASSTLGAPPPNDFVLVGWGVGNPPDPDSGSVGMFDPSSGDYLGDLIPPDQDRIAWPHGIAVGPDRLVYIADSLMGSVWRYTLTGQFVDEFLGEDDGIDIPRDIEFIGDTLYVCNANRHPSNPSLVVNTSIERFSMDGTSLGPFIAPDQGLDVWDLLPLDDGRFFLSEGGLSSARGTVTLRDVDGSLIKRICQIRLPNPGLTRSRSRYVLRHALRRQVGPPQRANIIREPSA